MEEGKSTTGCKHFLRPWVRKSTRGPTLWASCQNCRRRWFLSPSIPEIAERALRLEAEADEPSEAERPEADQAEPELPAAS